MSLFNFDFSNAGSDFQPQTMNFQSPMMNSFSSFTDTLMGPATRNYFNFAGQVPNRQDYNRGFWGKLGSGLVGGLTGALDSDATKGLGITQGLLDKPYNQAMDNYLVKAQQLGNAANVEQNLLGAARQLYNDQTSRQQFADTQKFNYAQLGQQGDLARLNYDLQAKQLDRSLANDAAQRDYQNRALGVSQYNANTQRMLAENPMRYMGGMGSFLNAMNAPLRGINQPNTAMMKFKMDQALRSDPILSKAFDPKNGRFDPSQLDQNGMNRLLELQKQLGVLPQDYVTAPVPEQPQNQGFLDRLMNFEF